MEGPTRTADCVSVNDTFWAMPNSSRARTELPIRRVQTGKSAAWRRINALRFELQLIVDAMHGIALEFKCVFLPPWPVHLTVQCQSTGAVYLRWRRAGCRGDQPYVLLEGPIGIELLRGIDPLACRVYMRFARRAVDLNLEHSLRLNELRRLERYVSQLEALVALKRTLGSP